MIYSPRRRIPITGDMPGDLAVIIYAGSVESRQLRPGAGITVAMNVIIYASGLFPGLSLDGLSGRVMRRNALFVEIL